jgi:hypothetical protein
MGRRTGAVRVASDPRCGIDRLLDVVRIEDSLPKAPEEPRECAAGRRPLQTDMAFQVGWVNGSGEELVVFVYGAPPERTGADVIDSAV